MYRQASGLFGMLPLGMFKFRTQENPDLWHEKFIDSITEVTRPKLALEIGIAEGRVTRILSRNCSEVIAIDVDEAACSRVSNLSNVRASLGDSESILKQLAAKQTLADFVFIDGDHRIESVMNDFRLALGMLSEEGVILLHDTFPRSRDYVSVKNEWCSNSYLAPERIRTEYPTVSVITMPVHPGLTLVQRNIRQPAWISNS